VGRLLKGEGEVMKNWQAATIAIAWVGILLALPLFSVTYYAIEYSLPMPPIPAPPSPDYEGDHQKWLLAHGIFIHPPNTNYIGGVILPDAKDLEGVLYDETGEWAIPKSGRSATIENNSFYSDGKNSWNLFWWGEDTGEK
jgi:hypothetical protein